MGTMKLITVAAVLLAPFALAHGSVIVDPYLGPIVVSLDDKSSGTSHTAAANIPGPGTLPGEDGWGIFFIQSIYKGQIGATGAIGAIPGGRLWADGDGGRELVGVFWDVADIAWSTDPASGTQTIEGSGMKVAIWEQDSGTLGAAWNAGSAGRMGPNPWDYLGIGMAGNPSLWLTAQSVPGFLGTLAFPQTEYVSTFNPTVGAGHPAGGAKVYVEVAPIPGLGTGSYNSSLDSNYYAGVFPSGVSTADLYLDMATTLNNPTNTPIPGADDFTVWSNDDTTGVVIPEPATLALLALGGAVLLRRRR